MSRPTGRHWISGRPGAENLTIGDFEVPRPGNNELLIEVDAAALNFSDILMIDGTYQIKPPRPFTPGQEIAGTVIETGKGSRFRSGDKIASKVVWGGLATHALVRDDMAFSAPEGLPPAECAALPVVYTTAYVALTEATRLSADETVLVHAAAGGIGLAAVQIAAAAGATVIATASSPEKRALAMENGAAHCIDYRGGEWVEQCLDLTGGRGTDVVVDPVGGDTTLSSLAVMAHGGRLMIVGFACGQVAKIPAHKLLLKRLSAIGVYWNHDTDGEMLQRVTGRMIDDAQTGRIRPVTDIRSGLDALPAALGDLSSGKTAGKVVLDISGELSNG